MGPNFIRDAGLFNYEDSEVMKNIRREFNNANLFGITGKVSFSF